MTSNLADRAKKAYDHPSIGMGVEDAKLMGLDPNGDGIYLPLSTVYGFNPSDAIQLMKSATVEVKKDTSKKKGVTKDNKLLRKVPRFGLIGVPASLKKGDGTQDSDFESREDLKKRNLKIFQWKMALKDFYHTIFENDQDRACIDAACINFASFALVSVATEEVGKDFKMTDELPADPKHFEIISSITFTTCDRYYAQVLWLGTSRVEPQDFQVICLKTRKTRTMGLDNWRGKGTATLLIVAMLKHVAVHCKTIGTEGSEGAEGIEKRGPEIYLQCSTADIGHGSAREFYLHLGFRPCVPVALQAQQADNSHTLAEYQKIDHSCKDQLPSGLQKTARSSLGSWIDVADCIMELLHLSFGNFGIRNPLPPLYFPPAPWSLQNTLHFVWPPCNILRYEHLRACSKQLTYLKWSTIGSPIKGVMVSREMQYPDCVGKDGMIKQISKIYGVTRMRATEKSYLNDEMINGFAGWLMTVFPGIISYVPTTITTKAANMAKIYHIVSSGKKGVGKKESEGYNVKESQEYLHHSRGVKGWLCGKDNFLDRPLLLYPVNTEGNHWELGVALNPGILLETNPDPDTKAGFLWLNPVHPKARYGNSSLKKESNGFMFFLNYAAAVMKLMKNKSRDENDATGLHIEQEYGPCNGIWKATSKYAKKFPRLMFPDNMEKGVGFPVQRDSYNCGVLVCMHMLDFASFSHVHGKLSCTQHMKNETTLKEPKEIGLSHRWEQPPPAKDGTIPVLPSESEDVEPSTASQPKTKKPKKAKQVPKEGKKKQETTEEEKDQTKTNTDHAVSFRQQLFQLFDNISSTDCHPREEEELKKIIDYCAVRTFTTTPANKTPNGCAQTSMELFVGLSPEKKKVVDSIMRTDDMQVLAVRNKLKGEKIPEEIFDPFIAEVDVIRVESMEEKVDQADSGDLPVKVSQESQPSVSSSEVVVVDEATHETDPPEGRKEGFAKRATTNDEADGSLTERKKTKLSPVPKDPSTSRGVKSSEEEVIPLVTNKITPEKKDSSMRKPSTTSEQQKSTADTIPTTADTVSTTKSAQISTSVTVSTQESTLTHITTVTQGMKGTQDESTGGAAATLQQSTTDTASETKPTSAPSTITKAPAVKEQSTTVSVPASNVTSLTQTPTAQQQKPATVAAIPTSEATTITTSQEPSSQPTTVAAATLHKSTLQQSTTDAVSATKPTSLPSVSLASKQHSTTVTQTPTAQEEQPTTVSAVPKTVTTSIATNQQPSSQQTLITRPTPASANPQGKPKNDDDYPDQEPVTMETNDDDNMPDAVANSPSDDEKPFSGLAIESMSAQEIWNLAKPSVTDDKSGKIFKKRPRIKRKMDVTAFLQLHFDAAKHNDKDFKEWHEAEYTELEKLEREIEDLRKEQKGRLTEEIKVKQFNYRERKIHWRKSAQVRREARAKLVQEWEKYTAGKIVALRNEIFETRFSGLIVWIGPDQQVQRCVMPLAKEWIDGQFSKETIARMMAANPQEEEGFVPITDAEMVNSEMIEMDTRHVTKVKYIPPRTEEEPARRGRLPKRGRKRRREIPEEFKVQLSDSTVEDSSYTDIMGRFGHGYVERIKKKTAEQGIQFWHVPVGDVRNRDAEPQAIAREMENRREERPRIAYPQGDHDTCVFSSCASAFSYANVEYLANMIEEQKFKSRMIRKSKRKGKPTTELGRLRDLICDNSDFRIKKIKKHTSPIGGGGGEGALNQSAINTVIVKDSEGSRSHAITIFDGWIFDSNEDYALPLCEASLNYITTSVGRTSRFVNIEFGYEFSENKGGKRKSRRSLLQPHLPDTTEEDKEHESKE